MLHRYIKSAVLVQLLSVLFLKQSDAGEEWFNRNVKSVTVKYDVINILNLFIRNEENRLNNIRESVQVYNLTGKNGLTTMAHREMYVGHPVNSYALIRKLTRDWNLVKNILRNSNFNDERVKEKTNETESNLLFLRSVLNDTMYAIGRIQETYGLVAQDMAAGVFGNLKLNFRLTYETCAKIGKYFYDNMNYLLASQWLKVALEMVKNKTDDSDLIYSLAKSEFLEGFHIEPIKHLLILPYELYNLDKTEHLLDHIVQMKQYTIRQNLNFEECYDVCKRMMDGGNLNGNLKCRYNKENSPFLKLAPLKEEIVRNKPFIRIFRDVISDTEIQWIKTLSSDRLVPGQTYKTSDNAQTNYNVRATEIAFLHPNIHKSVKNILKRTEDITTYNSKHGEQLQVAHYAVGGYYMGHLDGLNANTNTVKTYGNRIATVLFYLNDVIQGGGTAFTKLNLVVKPTKGSALVWHNLHVDGERNEATTHCACPVLVGQKWILTEWLREFGQTATCDSM